MNVASLLAIELAAPAAQPEMSAPTWHLAAAFPEADQPKSVRQIAAAN
jgi:hypothetical protein